MGGKTEVDGDIDLVVGSHGGDMHIFYNNENNVYSKIPFDSVLQIGDDRSVTLQIFTDIDKDGDVDIVSQRMSAWIDGWNLPTTVDLWLNDSSGNYTWVSDSHGLMDGTEEAPVVIGDFDNDGDLDVAGANVHWDPPLDGYYMYRNNTNGNNWLVVRVNAGVNNPFGVGAKVKVSAGGQLLGYREITNASAMHQALEAHFGLGGCNCDSVTVEIIFPDGSAKTNPNVVLGRKLVITTAGAVVNQIFSDGFE